MTFRRICDCACIEVIRFVAWSFFSMAIYLLALLVARAWFLLSAEHDDRPLLLLGSALTLCVWSRFRNYDPDQNEEDPDP